MPASALHGRVTLVNGATLCVSSADGAVRPEHAEGVLHRDVRVLSRLELTVDGDAPDLLASERRGARTAEWTFVLERDRHGSPTTVLLRRREVGAAVRERFTVKRYAGGAARHRLTVRLAADFTDVLTLKAGGVAAEPARFALDGGRLVAAAGEVSVEVTATAGVLDAEGRFVWEPELAVGAEASTELTIAPRSPLDDPGPGWASAAAPARTLAVRSADTRWRRSVATSLADLAGLRVEVPGMGLRYLGAGAPWYMALFGRDTLLAAWESLVAGTRTAVDVLGALAARQGTGVDERTGEQPGRVLHELRTGHASVFGVAPGTPFYGTVDASPLFVVLLAEAHRWGADGAEVAALLPAARAALRWCAEHGDVDGDGFVEYVPDAATLENQGWKDSGDAMVHADGSPATGPIALAEVQGYVYAACLGLAELEERLGDPGAAPALRARAARLRERFVAAFWLDEPSLVAMALDGDKRPLAVASSNIGHVLWSGVLDGALAARAADRLVEPDLACTWGLRTLGSGERAYSPLSYHLGSVWPHDTAIGIAGLVRCGRVAEAGRLTDGLLAVAEATGWRLPELLGGFSRAEVGYPVPYPVACMPQAWAAAAPLALLRSALGLEPDVPAGVVRVAPGLADGEELLVEGIPLGAGTLSVRARGRTAEVLACPPGLDVRADA